MITFDNWKCRSKTIVGGFVYTFLAIVVFNWWGWIHVASGNVAATVGILLAVAMAVWLLVYVIGLGLYVWLVNSVGDDIISPLAVTMFVVLGGWVCLLLVKWIVPQSWEFGLSADIAAQLVMGFIAAVAVTSVESFQVGVLAVVKLAD